MVKDKDEATKILTKKKILEWIRFIVVTALILGGGYLFFNYVPFVAKYNHYVIATGSMDPVIKAGDVVFIDTSINPDDLKVGDIIAFYTDKDPNDDDNAKDDIVVHYIAEITTVDGIRVFRSKPEISDSMDSWYIYDWNIIGLEVGKVSKIGPLVMFAQSKIGRITLLVDIVVIYAIIEVMSYDKKKNKDIQSEIEDKDTE